MLTKLEDPKFTIKIET